MEITITASQPRTSSHAATTVLENRLMITHIFSFLAASDLSNLMVVSKGFNKAATIIYNGDETFIQVYRNTFDQENVVHCQCENNPQYSLTNHKSGCSTLFFVDVIYTYGTKSKAEAIFAAATSSNHFLKMNMQTIFGLIGVKFNVENIDPKYSLKDNHLWAKSYLLFLRTVLATSRQSEIAVNMLIPALFVAFHVCNKKAMEAILTSSELNKKADDLLLPEDNNKFVAFLIAMEKANHLDVLENVLAFEKLNEKLRKLIEGIFKTKKILETFQNQLDEIVLSFTTSITAVKGPSPS